MGIFMEVGKYDICLSYRGKDLGWETNKEKQLWDNLCWPPC